MEASMEDVPPQLSSPPATGAAAAAAMVRRSWSIHSRQEIIEKYEVMERVGTGAYSDVYRGRRRSDSVFVALKEVHDYQAAFREVEALQILRNCPNVVVLHEFFWREEEDAVLVLEFLDSDLSALIADARRNSDSGIPVGEIKRWMIQILLGVDSCHRNSVVHRDLKPSNFLISNSGVLKLADFGQARILPSHPGGGRDNPKRVVGHDNMMMDEGSGTMTSCVGTRWFRAPELLYGSTRYGPEVDLWSLGCVFAELLVPHPLFPGTSDIDQLSRIFAVLGDMDARSCPARSTLPDYNTISFRKVPHPAGLESRLPGRARDEVVIVKRLLCFDPTRRPTPTDLLQGNYLSRDEPPPVPVPDLRVPTLSAPDPDSFDGSAYSASDSDFEEGFDFGGTNDSFFYV